ncbi:putative succinyl-CoA ligase [GDP-forming] beta-chain [Leishmania braziliensis MHOM/BR/75/M2904]|uniref:Succinate--CoA ligase [ADP-forming] subunit beta, mitochondrial n=2 Tax=Leishmania braziliensis TaxID=5660 RepID=A4HPG1_LEIBR|nr:putative succinyl-CoA ligase [GDP-forming] beta-chain [Leishmania braziliensis MHOM/BR/75/M2904]CAJ2481570.1 unnamed protein product [Leishmania braziliensis]CAM44069.1 putative succinyl-CoA ligase [GDP-forming] beta-chain [Leishmania braziliensis MHOM/BR/75/M2904]SYZ70131.1 succinyl-CoA_ligase_[GDP-forming]_beta-chain [Leishmania braziliensis MHOM/BR/75/M2904]
MLRFGRLCTPKTAGVQRRFLNIHEYQSKKIIKDNGGKVEFGIACKTIEEVEAACAKIKTEKKVVKSQILAGGRGKGVFKDGFQGGVHVCDSAAAAVEAAKHMLGNTLVTKQTGPKGQLVSTLYVTEAIADIKRELYLSLILDRKSASPMFVGSAEGGTSIEELAKTNPEKIKTMKVNVAEGVDHDAAVAYAKELGFSGETAEHAAEQIKTLYNIGKSNDCTMVEINPFVELKNGDVMEIDAKLSFDDNAAFRQKAIFSLEDQTMIDSKEVLAKKHDLNYIALEGNVGCLVNGAGLAMATMDAISLHGGSAANFLDAGGSASEAQIVSAFKIITGDPHVKSILVNIFGGIMHCDVIAQGVVNASKTLSTTIPIVVRLCGTNEQRGKDIISNSGLAIHSADDFDSAARKAVELAK